MKIYTNLNGNKLSIALEGRLDTTTAPLLEGELNTYQDITELELDFQKLDYLSSAGLRVILSAQKMMNKRGVMVIKNVNNIIMDIFEITGFVNILTIQ